MVSSGPLIPEPHAVDEEELDDGEQLPAGEPGTAEAVAGLVLVGLSIVAGIGFRLHPEANRVDRRGFAAIPKSPDSTVLHRITDLGLPAVLVALTLLAALVVVRRDRWRAMACVGGPLLVAVLVEYGFKPLVDRHYLGVLSYPSGNVADLAAVATALAAAAPRWIRPVVIAAGAVAVGLMMVAVVGLRWHYPTDALAGAVLGVGVVLLVDGAVHLVVGRAPDHA
jgi:membrane-associated phospholipid phosphatase